MTAPEVLPPTDPELEAWRRLMREQAICMRIMREEMERENPLPPPLPYRPSWAWLPTVLTIVLLTGAFALGLLLGSREPTPLHVIVEQAPP